MICNVLEFIWISIIFKIGACNYGAINNAIITLYKKIYRQAVVILRVMGHATQLVRG